jgi:hypothetical protein
MVAGFAESTEMEECFGCGGPIRTEYAIPQGSISKRTDPLRRLSLLFFRAEQRMNLGYPPTDILPLNGKDTHGERLAIPQQGQDHVWVRQLKCGRGQTTGANSFSVFRVFGSDKQVLMRRDQIMK